MAGGTRTERLTADACRPERARGGETLDSGRVGVRGRQGWTRGRLQPSLERGYLDIYVGPHVGNDPISRMVDHSREYTKIGQNRPFPRMDAFFWHPFWGMVALELFSIWAVRARPFKGMSGLLDDATSAAGGGRLHRRGRIARRRHG
eukprot:5388752-Pleurochrysis_carterae.AAC.1